MNLLEFQTVIPAWMLESSHRDVNRCHPWQLDCGNPCRNDGNALIYGNSLSRTQVYLSISPFSHADDKPLIVGSEQDYPPFALGSTAATADGFTVEL